MKAEIDTDSLPPTLNWGANSVWEKIESGIQSIICVSIYNQNNVTMSLIKELHLFSFGAGNDDSISMTDGTPNTLKSTRNAKPITPSSEFATEGSEYTTNTPSTVSFTNELSVASSSGNLSYIDFTHTVPLIFLMIFIFQIYVLLFNV